MAHTLPLCFFYFIAISINDKLLLEKRLAEKIIIAYMYFHYFDRKHLENKYVLHVFLFLFFFARYISFACRIFLSVEFVDFPHVWLHQHVIVTNAILACVFSQ